MSWLRFSILFTSKNSDIFLIIMISVSVDFFLAHSYDLMKHYFSLCGENGLPYRFSLHFFFISPLCCLWERIETRDLISDFSLACLEYVKWLIMSLNCNSRERERVRELCVTGRTHGCWRAPEKHQSKCVVWCYSECIPPTYSEPRAKRGLLCHDPASPAPAGTGSEEPLVGEGLWT